KQESKPPPAAPPPAPAKQESKPAAPPAPAPAANPPSAGKKAEEPKKVEPPKQESGSNTAGAATTDNTRGKSKSNPDGGGVDKPYPADGQPAGSQGGTYLDGNNGAGQDKRIDGDCDDNKGKACEVAAKNAERKAGEQKQ